MPAMPRSGLVVVEPKFVLGSLEAILNRPTMAFDIDQCLNRRLRRAPGGEVGEIAVRDSAPDQQAAGPQATIVFVELFSFEISQFEIAPVMQPWALGSCARRQALPVGWPERLGNVRSGVGNASWLVP